MQCFISSLSLIFPSSSFFLCSAFLPYLKYLVELVDLGLPREHWLHPQQLPEDAAHGPDVNVRGVLLGAQQQLRGAVPQGDDDGGVVLQGRPVLTRQPKIADLGMLRDGWQGVR